MRAVRAASLEDLAARTTEHLWGFLANGTTTVEAKTGYGLSLADEESSPLRGALDKQMTEVSAIAGRLAELPFTRGNTAELLINGDVWTDLPLAAIERPPESLAHLVLVPNPPHNPAGDLGLGWTYSGVSVLDPRLFAGCEPGAFPLKPLLERAQSAGRLTSQRHRGAWTDVGTPERLAALDAELRLGKVRHPVLSSPVG